MFKKITTAFMALCLCFLTACGSGEPASAPNVNSDEKSAVQEKLDSGDSAKALVAYFSRADENYNVGTISKGNTQIIAEYIAEQIGADSYHIETVTPYPADYDDCKNRASQEKSDNARPEIIGNVENMDSYDIVFLGYPIWWGDMPMAVYTFMESYDFSGKVIIPFNTHEGSGSSGTETKIKNALPDSQVLTGLVMQGATAQKFNSDTQDTVRSWLDDLGF